MCGCVGVCGGVGVCGACSACGVRVLFFKLSFLDTTPVLEVPNLRAPVGR